MTNLNISIERLIPIAELIEKVNYDKKRIVIAKYDLWIDGLRLVLKDDSREIIEEVFLETWEVEDMIDEVKGKDPNKAKYTWLRSKANYTEKEERLALIRLNLLILSSQLIETRQCA